MNVNTNDTFLLEVNILTRNFLISHHRKLNKNSLFITWNRRNLMLINKNSCIDYKYHSLKITIHLVLMT